MGSSSALLVRYFYFLLIAGCASKDSPLQPQTPIVPELPEDDNARGEISRVEPIPLNDLQNSFYLPNRDYLQPLLVNFSQSSVYRLENSQKLSNEYQFLQQVQSLDKYKTVFSLKQHALPSWGYVTTSIGRQGVVNAFLVRSEPSGGTDEYALVVKQMKICLVTGAGGIPEWRGGKWIFSKQPGYFECTGSIHRNIFRSQSGFPQVLGPYYSEQDTILVFSSLDKLKGLVVALKSQFPQLKIPVISF